MPGRRSSTQTKILVSARIPPSAYAALMEQAAEEDRKLTDVLVDRLSRPGGASRTDLHKVAELAKIGAMLKRLNARRKLSSPSVDASLVEIEQAIMRIVPYLP